MSTIVRAITLNSQTDNGITSDGQFTIFGTEESYGWDTDTYGFGIYSYGYVSYDYVEGKAGIE